MKKGIAVLLSVLCVIALAGCTNNSSPNTTPSNPPVDSAPGAPSSEPPINSAAPSSAQSESSAPEPPGEDHSMPSVNIHIDDKSFAAAFYDNDSARAIVAQMLFTLEMDDYASQEKVTALTFDLPSAQTEVPSTINAGDIYLWSGNNLVLFYTTFSNSYSYVPIGNIADTGGFIDALGKGAVSVTFSINE